MRPDVEFESCAVDDVLARTPAPIFVVNAFLEVVYANLAAARLVGRSTAELHGISFLTLFPHLFEGVADERSRRPGEIVFASLLGKTVDAVADCDGKRRNVELTVAHPSTHSTDLWIVAAHDMTTVDASYAELVRTHRELEDFNRMTVDRELRMIELKKEVNQALTESGKPPRYGDVDSF